MKIAIVSLNVGQPVQVPFQGKEVSTSIYKEPVDGFVYLSKVQLEGDGQADLVNHGGAEKAVCVYPYEHYAHWESELGKRLDVGAFGENLTTLGLIEHEVRIGDVFRFGEAIVQVSQPRQPCFKIAMKHGVTDFPLLVQQSGFTGFYFRVLQEGRVSRDSALVLAERHPQAVTVAFANRIMHTDKHDVDGIRTILDVPELSVNWRATFTKRLKGIEADTAKRLNGE